MNDKENLNILATFLYEILMGEFDGEKEICSRAHEILIKTELDSLENLANLNNSDDTPAKIFLSRRNLQTLINKLDRNKDGGNSHCGLMKYHIEDDPEEFRQNIDCAFVFAVEDDKYYQNRTPGAVLPEDTPK